SGAVAPPSGLAATAPALGGLKTLAERNRERREKD
ncbi:hypothetical protein A2U01_0091047, partial [Trifolium medium]|nr:hypothetical protein [Trifolium medium]